MRYPASEKLEIIRIIEQSHLPARRTLDQVVIPRRTFYRWYDRYLEGGPEALTEIVLRCGGQGGSPTFASRFCTVRDRPVQCR